VIFRWNWIFARFGGFLDFVDYGLTYFPWVHFADHPIFFFFRCFPVILFGGFFFRNCVGSWGARQPLLGAVVRVEFHSMILSSYHRVMELEPWES